MYRTALRRRLGVRAISRVQDLARSIAVPVRTVSPAVTLSLLLMLSATRLAHAAGTFVVDPSNPLANDAGPGDAVQPYRTISAAVGAQAGPGVTILVRPAIYREKVFIPANGRMKQPLVLRADPGAIIDGSEDLSATSAWAPIAGGVWLSSQVTWKPVQVFVDDLRLEPSAEAPAALPPGTFRYVAGAGLYVNLGAGPAGHSIAVGARSHGIQIMDRNSVRVEGFQVRRAETRGIEVTFRSYNIAIERNVIEQCGAAGIALQQCNGVMVRDNKVTGSNHHGIELRLGVSNAMLIGNEVASNARVGETWANGIYLSEASGNLLYRNNVHHNQDTGIEIQTNSNDNRVMLNRSWANGDHGFEHLFATGTLNVGNVAWGNAHDGFSVEGSATGTQLYNCIAAENGLAGTGYDLYVDSSSVAGFAADHLVLWKSDATPSVKFDRVTYPSVAAWIGARGIAPHSVNGDPRFVAPASGDFHLLAGSVAIDAAMSDAPHVLGSDADGLVPMDDPATANTGTGPVSFMDIGAYEFSGVNVGVGDTPGVTHVSVRVAPNPARSSVAFARSQAGAADEARVFDVAGREVWRGTFSAGARELRWNLLDARGSRVRSGLYLARIGGTSPQTVRVMVLD